MVTPSNSLAGHASRIRKEAGGDPRDASIPHKYVLAVSAVLTITCFAVASSRDFDDSALSVISVEAGSAFLAVGLIDLLLGAIQARATKVRRQDRDFMLGFAAKLDSLASVSDESSAEVEQALRWQSSHQLLLEVLSKVNQVHTDVGKIGMPDLEEVLSSIDTSSRRPKFEVFEAEDGSFRFRLVAANSEIVMQSEGYTRRADAEIGAETAKRLATKAYIADEATKSRASEGE